MLSGLSAVGTLPLSDKFALTGKLGEVRWEQQGDTRVGTATDHGTTPRYGLGLKYNFNPKLSLTAGWDRFNNIGNNTGTLGASQRNDTYTLGLRYQFY